MRETNLSIFIPTSVGILDVNEWSLMQNIHDSIAKGITYEYLLQALGFESLEEFTQKCMEYGNVFSKKVSKPENPERLYLK